MASQRDKQGRTEKQGNGNVPTQTSGTMPTPYRRDAMTPYGAWEPFRRMREEFEQLFDQFFQGWRTPWVDETQRHWNWGLKVQENEGNLVVRAEAPGFEPNEFDVQVQ